QQLDFTPDAVVVQGRGAPASSLIEYIEQEGAEVTPCQGNDLTSSCSQFSDRVMNGSVRFREQESLRLALDDAVKKDRKSTRLNSSHVSISYAVFCLKKKKTTSHVMNA